MTKDKPFKRIVRYLAGLNPVRLVLWFYFIWYLVVLSRYFSANPRIWLTAVGLSLLIVTALLLNTTASGRTPVKLEAWPTARLFLFPFCVSSFSALVKDHGFYLVFSPRPGELALGLLICAALALLALAARTWLGPRAAGGR